MHKRPSAKARDVEFDRDEFEQQVGEELERARQVVTSDSSTSPAAGGRMASAWTVATGVVNRFRPVPPVIWVIVRAVYGRSDKLGNPDYMAFSAVEPLLHQAAADAILGWPPPEELASPRVLDECVKIVGKDVAAAVCFAHAVCRRIRNTLAEGVWRPILDDALLRAQMGFHIGKNSRVFGPGRGILAGFSGRSGLAILIAAGTQKQAQEALSGLAAGVDISDVCLKVYGCDPLQVAALALIAGGCSRDIALGIAGYSLNKNDPVIGVEQHRWLSAFSIIENLRMGRKEQIQNQAWQQLQYNEALKGEAMQRIKETQRRGHGWSWISQPQVRVAEEAGAAERAPSRRRVTTAKGTPAAEAGDIKE